MALIENLRALSLANGSSGDDGAVRGAILAELAKIPDCKAFVDGIGNILAEKRGANRAQNRVMFCARMDEAGFIVTNIDENGFIQFECIGKVDSRVVIGRRVLIGDCAVPALVGSKALHMLDKSEDGVLADTDKLYFDIGADSKEEAERRVHIGDRAVFEGGFLEFGDGFAMGKALEGRAGCAALLELLSAPANMIFAPALPCAKKLKAPAAALPPLPLRRISPLLSTELLPGIFPQFPATSVPAPSEKEWSPPLRTGAPFTILPFAAAFPNFAKQTKFPCR